MIALQLAGIALSAFVIALSGALMPGPLLTITISESLKGGKWTGPLLIVGHAALELSLILLVLAGFGHFFRINRVAGGISLMGGVILLWMGWDTLVKGHKLSLEYSAVGQSNPSCGPILTGILASISNPYWSIWWATIGIGYMAASLVHGWIGIAAFFIGHITADFSWYTLVSFSVAGGRRFVSNRIYRGLIVACGCILCIFGLVFLYWGFQKIGLL